MAFDFCLPAIGTENAADWAAVLVGVWAAAIAAVAAVVGIAGAAATVWVALLAHRTSQRATEISEQAAQIARQQHQEAVTLRTENARIVGRLLLYEVSGLPKHLNALLEAWEGSIEWNDSPQITNGKQLLRVLEGLTHSLLPGAERVEERIHYLPDSLGADLATLIGGGRTLAEIGAIISPRVTLPKMSNGGKFGFTGDGDMLGALRTQLAWMLELSQVFEKDFMKFVVVRPSDAGRPDADHAATALKTVAE